jgi:hypothetical protein
MTTKGRFAASGVGAAGRWCDAHQRVVGRLRQSAAVEHHFVVEGQHRRLARFFVLQVLVAALAQHVQRQDRALPGVDPVFGGGAGQGRAKPGAAEGRRVVCHARILDIGPGSIVAAGARLHSGQAGHYRWQGEPNVALRQGGSGMIGAGPSRSVAVTLKPNSSWSWLMSWVGSE